MPHRPRSRLQEMPSIRPVPIEGSHRRLYEAEEPAKEVATVMFGYVLRNRCFWYRL